MSSVGQSHRSTHNFDVIAGEEYDESIPSHVMRHLTQRRLKMIRSAAKNGRVLDVGCGTGRILGELDPDSYQRYGIDVSEGMLQHALRKDSLLRCIRASATQIPYADNSFDLVFCAAVLHHVADKDAVSEAIQEIVRVTKVNGTAIIWDHNPLNPYWPIIMRRVPQDIGEERLISRGEIDRTLRKIQKRQRLLVKWHQMTFIPDFAPIWSLSALKVIEAICEITPLLNRISAHNVAVIVKKTR